MSSRRSEHVDGEVYALAEWQGSVAAVRLWRELQAAARERRTHCLDRTDALLLLQQQRRRQGQSPAGARPLAADNRDDATLETLVLERERLLAAVAVQEGELVRLRELTQSLRAAERASDAEGGGEAAANLLRSHAVSDLAQCCLTKVQELRQLFPVTLSTNALSGRDRICRWALPVMPRYAGKQVDADGGYADLTAEQAEEEARAMGCAAQLLQALAIIFGCTLPYPLLPAGARSRIAVRPGPCGSPASLVTDAGSLPLYAVRASDRALLVAGVSRFMRNVLTVARAMGKSEEDGIWHCGLRIGVALHTLLLP